MSTQVPSRPKTAVEVPHHMPGRESADRKQVTQGRWASVLLAPSLILLAIVIIYPVINAIIMSFQKDAGLDPATGFFLRGWTCGLR